MPPVFSWKWKEISLNYFVLMSCHLTLFPAHPQPFEEHADAFQNILQPALLVLIALVMGHRLRVVGAHGGLERLEDGEHLLGSGDNFFHCFLSYSAHCGGVHIGLALLSYGLRCWAGHLN